MLLVASNRRVPANDERNDETGKRRESLAWTRVGFEDRAGSTGPRFPSVSLLSFVPLRSVSFSP